MYKKLKKFENLHILLWLIKDSCWMLELKIIGTLMVFPTLFLAIYISYLSINKLQEFLLNISVTFWILANSLWMIHEFYFLNIKQYAIICFVLGLISILTFYALQIPALKNKYLRKS